MATGEAIQLEYKMKKGEEIRYKTTVDSEQTIKEGDQKQEMVSHLEMVMLQKCSDVAADGTMTVDVVIESGTLKREGAEEPIPNVGQVISMKMKKNGEISQTSVQMDFTQPAFPTKKIAKKEKWTADSKVNIPGRPEPIKLDYNYILWDFVKKEGHETVEIKVSCPDTKIELQEGVEQVLSATGTTYFAHKEGMLIMSEVETKTDISAPKENAAINTHIRVRVELVDAKKGSGVSAGAADDFQIAK
ncbi:MAG: hypothetical protein RDV48_08850 [Candidatus Eremiobacteraeota bacterium]|nr:hypothetical protein [Candidatus Eremiobacteraeota bacterium]